MANVREYIGARYVPVFADPVEWDDTRTYEPLTMVQHLGETYMTRQAVPIGIQLPDTSQGIESNDFWVHMSNWNAQVEAYRKEVLLYNGRISTVENDLPIAEFDSTNTVKAAIDETNDKLGSGFDSTNTVAAAISGVQSDLTNAVNAIDDVNENQLFVFDAVAEMKASEILFDGAYCKTNNYRSGDGGGAFYKIVESSETADEFTVIAVHDADLRAINISIEECGYVDIRWTGAIGDFTSTSEDYSDNSSYFQKAIDYINLHRSMAIKVIGRYGLKSTVNCTYSLPLFGEYVISRELSTSLNYNLEPVSQIHVNAGVTAFRIVGSGNASTFSYVNIDKIKFTGGGSANNCVLIDAPTWGAPSRPNWIRDCEISSFTKVFNCVGTSTTSSNGSNFFNFDFDTNNCFYNDYVFYVKGYTTSIQSIGNVNIINSVMEHGGSQLYITECMGSINIQNSLIEGCSNGTMTLKVIRGSITIADSYFEANTNFEINVSASNIFNSFFYFRGNRFVNSSTTTIVVSGITEFFQQTTGMSENVTHSAAIAEVYENVKPDKDLYYIKTETPCISSKIGNQEVGGSTSNSYIRKGLYSTTYTSSTTTALSTTHDPGYLIFSFYVFDSNNGTVGAFTAADGGISGYTGITLYSNTLCILIVPVTATIPRMRLRFTNSTVSNVVYNYVPSDDFANINIMDYAYCVNTPSA